jgi:hypothetical protein
MKPPSKIEKIFRWTWIGEIMENNLDILGEAGKLITDSTYDYVRNEDIKNIHEWEAHGKPLPSIKEIDEAGKRFEKNGLRHTRAEILKCTDCGNPLIYTGRDKQGEIWNCEHCCPPFGHPVYLERKIEVFD